MVNMYSGVTIAYFKAFDANVFSPDRSSFCFLEAASAESMQLKANSIINIFKSHKNKCNNAIPRQIYLNIATWADLNWL